MAITRTLNHGDLVDLKQAAERGLRQVPEVLMARRMDDPEGMLDALGNISDAFVFVLSHLGLDDLDDEDPEGTIVPVEQVATLERITRNGGLADG